MFHKERVQYTFSELYHGTADAVGAVAKLVVRLSTPAMPPGLIPGGGHAIFFIKKWKWIYFSYATKNSITLLRIKKDNSNYKFKNIKSCYHFSWSCQVSVRNPEKNKIFRRNSLKYLSAEKINNGPINLSLSSNVEIQYFVFLRVVAWVRYAK